MSAGLVRHPTANAGRLLREQRCFACGQPHHGGTMRGCGPRKLQAFVHLDCAKDRLGDWLDFMAAELARLG